MTNYKKTTNVWNANAFQTKMRALPSNSRRGLCPRTPTLAVSNPCLQAGAYSSVLGLCVCQGAFAAYPRQPGIRWLRYSTISLTDPKRRRPSKSRLIIQCILGTVVYFRIQSIPTVKEGVIQRCFILKQRFYF